MKVIYFIIGIVCFALGAIGVVFPVLPTTPFLLAAAFCFTRSSKRVNDWFIQTKLYKNHLDSFVKERSMTLKTKAMILSFASLMLLFPLIFIDNIFMRCFIIFLYIFKYYYFVCKIKTIPENLYE